MSWLGAGVAFAAALFVMWALLRPRYDFVVRIVDGVAKTTRGRVLSVQLDEINSLCRGFGLKRGWVGGVRTRKHVRLYFSSNLPPEFRQRMRNMWDLH